jgi:hypothetical protein
LQQDATHNHVIEDIDEFQSERYGLKKSNKMALNKTGIYWNLTSTALTSGQVGAKSGWIVST